MSFVGKQTEILLSAHQKKKNEKRGKKKKENSHSMEKISSFLNKAEKNAAVSSCDIWLHK